MWIFMIIAILCWLCVLAYSNRFLFLVNNFSAGNLKKKTPHTHKSQYHAFLWISIIEIEKTKHESKIWNQNTTSRINLMMCWVWSLYVCFFFFGWLLYWICVVDLSELIVCPNTRIHYNLVVVISSLLMFEWNKHFLCIKKFRLNVCLFASLLLNWNLSFACTRTHHSNFVWRWGVEVNCMDASNVLKTSPKIT